MKQGLLIDMDGVIYSGEALITGADKFIKKLIDEDIPFAFMTNNSQRTPLEVVRKLKGLGIKVEESHVYTSAMATGKFLSDQRSPHREVFHPNGKGSFYLKEQSPQPILLCNAHRL